MKRTHCRQSAFTLIELLVVIAIISILASLLLPSLGRARDMAKAITCKNNQKQCGIAFSMYAFDNNDIVALNSNRGSGTYRWWLYFLSGAIEVGAGYPEKTTDYLKNRNLAVCPTEKPYSIGTDMSYCYGTRSSLDSSQPGNFTGESYSSGSVFVKLSRMTRPSMYYFIADSYHGTYGQQLYRISGYNGTYNNSHIHLRHSKKANQLLGDGHVSDIGVNDAKSYGFSGAFSDTKVLISL